MGLLRKKKSKLISPIRFLVQRGYLFDRLSCTVAGGMQMTATLVFLFIFVKGFVSERDFYSFIMMWILISSGATAFFILLLLDLKGT